MKSSRRDGTEGSQAFVEDLDSPSQFARVTEKKPPRPRECRNYARKAVAESMPDIVKSFVCKAKEGSVPHFNLLTKFGGFDHRPAAPPRKRRGKSFAERLRDDMKQHQATLIAANNKRRATEGDHAHETHPATRTRSGTGEGDEPDGDSRND